MYILWKNLILCLYYKDKDANVRTLISAHQTFVGSTMNYGIIVWENSTDKLSPF